MADETPKADVNLMQVLDGHCFRCHKNTTPEVQHACEDAVPTACGDSCEAKWRESNPYNKKVPETPVEAPGTNKNVEKTSDSQYTDPETGKFKPGNPGGGRPKGALAFKTAIEKWADREAAKEGDGSSVTKLELITKKLIEMAEAGNILAIKEIADRIDGKAKQSIDHTSLGERLGIDPLKQSLVNEAVQKMFEKKP